MAGGFEECKLCTQKLKLISSQRAGLHRWEGYLMGNKLQEEQRQLGAVLTQRAGTGNGWLPAQCAMEKTSDPLGKYVMKKAVKCYTASLATMRT